MLKVLFSIVLALACAYTVYNVVSPVFHTVGAAFDNALAHAGEMNNGKLASKY